MNPDSAITPNFSAKLLNYSTATASGVVGALASFESAEAALMVTPSGASITYDTMGVAQLALDLDGNTVDDVLVTVPASLMLSAQGLNSAGLAGTVATFFYPTGFQAGDVVSAGAVFSGGTANISNSFGSLALEAFGTFPAAGEWAGGATKYLGVEFEDGGNTYYGWVHIEWNPGTETATILRYAYEDEAGVGALVPEPSSLALLALGATGLVMRRRRKVA